MADDQQVEELPQGRQAELLGRGRQLEAGQVVADVAGGDPDERDLPVGVVAPGEEVAHGVGVVPAGVGVGDLALEELVPGELGPGARGGDDRRRRPDRVVGPAASGGRPVVSRVEDDLGRIAHFGWVPCSDF